jgi:choline dehydrogenase-like flavoprotein
MVDAGIRLEPERAEIVNNLSQSQPELWDRQYLKNLVNSDLKDPETIPLKLRFGSSYPYDGAKRHLGVSNNGVGVRPSLAFGGLSSVWGAAMLPYMEQDVLDWPIGLQELNPHYEAVLRLTGLSADRDDLADILPLFTNSPGYLLPSRQASSMWRAMCRNRDKLRRAGIIYGRARVAIKAARGSRDPGCLYCGLCMYGCPYHYIYNSEQTVLQLQVDERFSYQPDVVVTKVEEDADRVLIRGYDRLNRNPIEVKADRVYLAAGVISTTGILLRSMAAYERPIMMKDSQYFLLPLLLTTRIPNVKDERLHTLSQIFLEIFDNKISPHCVHLQVYSFNSLIARKLRKSMGRLAPALELLSREIEGRLMVALGYLHSAQSGAITITLRGYPGKESLQLSPIVKPATKLVVQKIVRKLLRNSLNLGTIPVLPLLDVTAPGRGFHVGGTFPMRKAPGEFETDLWGRPRNWQRVHAVDSSILPTIAATTVTFTAMANAHRIASEFGETE